MVFKQWPPLNVLRGFEAAARLGSFHQAAQGMLAPKNLWESWMVSTGDMAAEPCALPLKE